MTNAPCDYCFLNLNANNQLALLQYSLYFSLAHISQASSWTRMEKVCSWLKTSKKQQHINRVRNCSIYISAHILLWTKTYFYLICCRLTQICRSWYIRSISYGEEKLSFYAVLLRVSSYSMLCVGLTIWLEIPKLEFTAANQVKTKPGLFSACHSHPFLSSMSQSIVTMPQYIHGEYLIAAKTFNIRKLCMKKSSLLNQTLFMFHRSWMQRL